MKILTTCSVLFATVLVSGLAQAEIKIDSASIPAFEALVAEDEIVFEPLEDLGASGTQQLLINGTPVDPKQFPGVLRMTSGGTCTASLVGPGTVLLAAHCLPDNSKIRFKLGNGSVKGICKHAPDFNSTSLANDLALCLLSNKVTGLAYETVDISTPTSSGEIVALTGYGCTVQGGPLDFKLRLGLSKIVARPPGFKNDLSTIYTASNLAAGEAVLCPGDSGGPLFRTGDDLAGPRKIVGINSRTTYSHGVSLFAASASASGRKFLQDWVEVNRTEVCGVNKQTSCK